MNNSDLQKAQEAKQTLDLFFGQFESDVYTKIVLEELFKELLTDGKSIPVPRQK